MGKTKRLLLALGSVALFTSAAAAHAAPLNFHLKYTDNSDNEDGFRAYRIVGNPPVRTKLGEVGPNVTSIAMTDDVSTSPCYVVVAFNVVGESPDSNQACAISPKSPSTVTIVVP